MASGSASFSLEEVINICLQSNGDSDSDVDSSNGGMSSGEEDELDAQLFDFDGSDCDFRNEETKVDDDQDEDYVESDTLESNESSEDSLESDEVPHKRARGVAGQGRGRGVGCGRGQGEGRGRGRGEGRGRGRGERRGRGRGGGRGQGRGRGQGHGRGIVDDNVPEKSYGDEDTPNVLPRFTPERPVGFHFNQAIVRDALTKALDFFILFITPELITEICNHTNAYAWSVIERKQYYANKDGAWNETTPDEIYKLIALIIYMGMVNVSTIQRFWSTKTLYHGLWARHFMTRDRFKALMAALHVVDPTEEQAGDKLRKVSGFVDKIRMTCKELFQPGQNIAIDERMVKSKHRSGIRQFIKNKPVKFGIKLWVLADSSTGYTYDFLVYAGRNGEQPPSDNGLGYDVVMRLMEPLLNQGYNLFIDNFYTSITLVKQLFDWGTPVCGTTTQNRRGFPEYMKDGKKWVRGKERGSMRWERDGSCLVLQWKDNRLVTMLSSIDNANESKIVSRKSKVGNAWNNVDVQQPKCIERYNKHMNGVDKSDQKLAQNNVLRKCMRWWKVLFFHLIDVAVVNSFILFSIRQSQDPENPALRRPSKFSILEFREELVRNLGKLDEFGDPPKFDLRQPKSTGEFETVHMPTFTDVKRNCKVCYQMQKKELKVKSMCNAPQCQVFLHCSTLKAAV